MRTLTVSEAIPEHRRIPVRLVDEAGDPVTGASPTGLVSKNGLAETPASGTFAEVAGGLYFYEFAATEVDTLGYVSLRVETANAEPFVGVAQVVAALIPPTPEEIADAILSRRVTGGATGTRTVAEALAASRNRVEIVDNTMTVYDVDDITPLWTAEVSTANEDPVRGINPA